MGGSPRRLFSSSLAAPLPCSPTTDKVDVGQKGWKLVHSGFQFAVWEAVFK